MMKRRHSQGLGKPEGSRAGANQAEGTRMTKTAALSSHSAWQRGSLCLAEQKEESERLSQELRARHYIILGFIPINLFQELLSTVIFRCRTSK